MFNLFPTYNDKMSCQQYNNFARICFHNSRAGIVNSMVTILPVGPINNRPANATDQFCLRTIAIHQVMQYRQHNWIGQNVKESSHSLFRCTTPTFTWKDNIDTFDYSSQYPNWDMNLGPPKYKAGVQLPPWLWHKNEECNLEGMKNCNQHIHKICVLQTGFRVCICSF